MTHADIPLPTAVRTLVDLLLQAVGRGLRVLMQRYGAPDEARRSNAGAFADLSYGFTVVRRLARILRYALVILALRVVPVDLPPVVSRASLRSGERTRCASFALTARWPSIFESGRVQPPHLARGASNRLDTLARKMEALSRALRNTMPLIRRLARSLARDVVVIGWRPPKRAPRRRDFWDELLNARDQASFDLSNWRRRADSS